MDKFSWAIEDEELWKFVTELGVRKGYSPADIRDAVTAERIVYGDAKPFVDAVLRREPVGLAVQSFIACMLLEHPNFPYHLKVVRQPGLRGAPSKAGLRWRDYLVTIEFEQQRQKGGFNKALQATAELLGMSESAVKGAVSRWRKLIRQVKDRQRQINP
jgi:hypothetical protein